MAILRVNKENNFTVISNAVFMNYDLSYKAKGLLCQMLSLPDGWSFSIEGLTRLASDGKSSVMSALNELKEAGYFYRVQLREGNRISGVEYVISETKLVDFQDAEKQNAEKQNAENPPQLNTKELNTKESSTKNNKRFVRPTVEEVAEYIREKGYHIDAEAFIDHYNSNGWKVGKTPMKDWKATVRNWERRRENNNGNDFRAGNSVRFGVSETGGRGSGTARDSGERVRAKLPPMATLSNETQ